MDVERNAQSVDGLSGISGCIYSTAMPLDPKLERELFETIYSSLQDTASNLGAMYSPQWNVRNDIARTLLTISSAVLVISISLSSRVIIHKWILGVCWTAFLLAILTAIATLWLSLGLFTLPGSIVNTRNKLREMIKDFDVTQPHEEGASIIDGLVARRLGYMEKLDRWAIRTLKASLSMFLIGLVCTGIVGWIQLRQ